MSEQRVVYFFNSLAPKWRGCDQRNTEKRVTFYWALSALRGGVQIDHKEIPLTINYLALIT